MWFYSTHSSRKSTIESIILQTIERNMVDLGTVASNTLKLIRS